jgi:hypothetical protein
MPGSLSGNCRGMHKSLGLVRGLTMPVIPEIGPGVRFLVIDVGAVEAGSLEAPIVHPIIVPLIRVEP